MTLSAEFSVNGDNDVQEHLVAYGATVTLVALSTAFRSISWSIASSSKSGSTAPTITPAGAPTGATASFVQVANPGDGLGRTWLVRCVQEDAQGNQSIAYRVVGTLNANGTLPVCADEQNHRDATHGWSQVFNQLLATGGGGVTDHGALSGLTDDDHGTGANAYDLAARPEIAYTGAASATVLLDARKHVTTSHPTANTLTIPPNASVAYPTGTLLVGTNIGAGTMTLTAGGGVTLNAPGGTLTVAQYGWWFAKKIATNTWQIFTGGSSSSGGGGMGFRYTYSTTTTDADPGAGTFRGNNATLSSVTTLYVDLAEYGGTDVTAWLDSLDDYAGAIKGVIRLSSLSDPTKWIEYTMTAWTTATGYRKLTVAYKDGPGGLTTTAGDTFFAFDYATTGVPNGSVTGQTIIWNGSAWVAGALDLADSDARTGQLPWANLATAIGDLGFTGLKSLSFTGEVDNGNSGTADTITWASGQPQKSTLTGNCTFTFTAPSANTSLQLKLIQDGTGGRTVTWPAAVTWIDGAPPSIGMAAGAVTFVSFWYDGTTYWGSGTLPGPVVGADLTNANVTQNITDGSQRKLQDSVLSASAKTLTLGTSGTPEVDEVIEVIVYSQSQNYILANGGPLADTLYTVIAGTKRILHAKWNGTDWRPAGKVRLG